MTTRMRIVHHPEAVAKILRSPGVTAEVAKRIARVMAAVGGEAAGFRSQVYQGRDRVRGMVWTATHEAREAEATDRTLTRSVGALR